WSSYCERYVFLSSRRRHTRSKRDWSSDVCSSDLVEHCDKEERLKEMFHMEHLKEGDRNFMDKEKKLQLLEEAFAEIHLRLESYQYEQFLQYYEMLIEKNKVMNLTSKIGRDTSELQSRFDIVCRLLLEKKNRITLK